MKYLAREVDQRRGTRALELMSVSATRGVIPRSEITVDEPRADDLSNYKVCLPGDIVVNRMSAYQGALGSSPSEGIVSPDYLVLRPSSQVHYRWLHYVMKSSWFVSEMSSRLRGIGSIGTSNVRTPRVSAEEIGQIVVSVPALDKQRAIADYLDRETARIDALIEKKQRMIELLQLRAESLIAANLDPAITRWGEAPLKSVAKLAVSNVDKKSYDGQVPVKLCNYTDVYYNRRITNQLDFMSATADAQQVQRLTLHAGDVLITKDSETADDIAVPALVQEDLPGVVLGYHLALIRPTSVNGDFLYWAIRSRRSRDAFSLAASGVTRVGLRQDAMGRVPIPAVPSAMQSDLTEAIERDVGLGEDAVRKLSAQANLLRERRQALITAAVTGEFEVPGVAA